MPEPLKEFDMVALVTDLAEYNLPAGQTGAIVYVHDNGQAFEVEFPVTPRDSIVATVNRELLLKLKGEPYSRAAV